MRRSGVLLPVTSLPSRFGIGTFSKEAYAFVDFLKEAGQKLWQILPLGPTGYGDSPYQAFSTFAGNPYLIDLEELIDYWEANHRIGTRYELMVNSVERRLVEHHQDRLAGNTVSPAMLFNGAKLVAAAATLCHEPKIQTPDGAYNPQGIPLEQVLPEWSTSERQTLLERPLFDEAHYGTVRFHHRSVREYLTARWLHDLLTHDGSRRQN